MILDFLQNGMMTIYIRKSHLKEQDVLEIAADIEELFLEEELEFHKVIEKGSFGSHDIDYSSQRDALVVQAPMSVLSAMMNNEI